MPFIPNIDEVELLKKIGVTDYSELVKIIPKNVKFDTELDLNNSISEYETLQKLNKIASKNKSESDLICFGGGGAYDHYIPSIIDFLSSRSEFYTAYTPYQAEVSQGTLQYLYEFQSMICELSGLDVANASLYDGASAVAEACSLALTASCKNTILLSSTINPVYKRVVYTYLQNRNVNIVEIDEMDGLTNYDQIETFLPDLAGIVIQSPNYYGIIENWRLTKDKIIDSKALLIAVSDPMSLSILESPGICGADIFVGEGQTLGIPMSYGGPYLGLMAVTNKLMRKMPGRIIGKTTDKNGKDGFVLTLQTREQHIRRERATSNICTNQGLMALRSTIYLSLLGKRGFPKLTKLCFEKSQYLASSISEIEGYSIPYGKSFVKEFVVKTPISANKIKNLALQSGFIINCVENDETDSLILLSVTEKRSKYEMDSFIQFLKSNNANI